MSPLLPRSARQSSRRVLAALAMGLAQEVTWLNLFTHLPLRILLCRVVTWLEPSLLNTIKSHVSFC